jgi:Lsr2
VIKGAWAVVVLACDGAGLLSVSWRGARGGQVGEGLAASAAGPGRQAGRGEIDLSPKNAEALRKALEPYVSAARRASGSVARRPGRSGRRAATAGPDSTAVREWAKAQGIEVKDRGRVPAELVVKFKEATQ